MFPENLTRLKILRCYFKNRTVLHLWRFYCDNKNAVMFEKTGIAMKYPKNARFLTDSKPQDIAVLITIIAIFLCTGVPGYWSYITRKNGNVSSGYFTIMGIFVTGIFHLGINTVSRSKTISGLGLSGSDFTLQ